MGVRPTPRRAASRRAWRARTRSGEVGEGESRERSGHSQSGFRAGKERRDKRAQRARRLSSHSTAMSAQGDSSTVSEVVNSVGWLGFHPHPFQSLSIVSRTLALAPARILPALACNPTNIDEIYTCQCPLQRAMPYRHPHPPRSHAISHLPSRPPRLSAARGRSYRSLFSSCSPAAIACLHFGPTHD